MKAAVTPLRPAAWTPHAGTVLKIDPAAGWCVLLCLRTVVLAALRTFVMAALWRRARSLSVTSPQYPGLPQGIR
jgi:hypothetical protein